MLGTSLLTDTIPHAVGNGQMQQLTAAQLSTKYGAGNLRTPSANFTLRFEGQIVHFYKNVPMVVTAALAAALTAASAPVS
jgi:hypothetical protein